MELKASPARSELPFATIIGLSSLLVGTAIYSYEQQFMTFVTPERAAYFLQLAEFYLLILTLTVGIAILDLRRILYRRIRVLRDEGFAKLTPGWLVPYVLASKRYRRYFVVTAVFYGLFYAIITSMIVYQPTIDFRQYYGAAVPSAIVTPCCGAPLFAPVVTVYLVNHLGLLLIPLTLLLLLSISTLVGLNSALAVFAFDNRAKSSGKVWLGGVGAIVGLFTGCPTCAGLFFANVLGGAGAVSFATLLAYYQPVFILLGVPVLVGTLYLTSRSLSKVFRDGCVYLEATRA